MASSPDKPADSERGDKPEDSKEILGDLQSIRELLDEPDEKPPTLEVTEELNDVEIPVLSDALEANVVQAEVTDENGLDQRTFKTLLDDAWQDSIQELFENARSRIEKNSTKWLPEDTDTLSAALKVRIDASVRAWLEDTLRANIDLLRERMVHELSEEILDHFRTRMHESQGDTDTNL